MPIPPTAEGARLRERYETSPLTTVLYEPGDGLFLIHRHLLRLVQAQEALAHQASLSFHPVDEGQTLAEIWRAVQTVGVHVKQRVRVTVDVNGYARATTAALNELRKEFVTLCLDTRPTTCLYPFKTTRRDVYEHARARVGASSEAGTSETDPPWDVLMWNERGYITETGIANVAVEVSRQGSTHLVTPRVSCGLVQGVMREQLLWDGHIEEGDVSVEDFLSAARSGRRIFVFNALRKLIPAKIISGPPSLSSNCIPLEHVPSLGVGVVIDCWDSFTNNLLPLLNVSDLSDADFEKYLADNVAVIRLHDFDWAVFQKAILPHLDWIIISPGPGRPDVYEDFGLCGDIIRGADVPVLGVCLGHQGIAAAYGGRISQSDEVMHGRTVDVCNCGSGLFRAMSSSSKMIRYNSLSVDIHSLPDVLEVTAWSRLRDSAGIEIMGLQHRFKPQFGFQFHLESTCSNRDAARSLMQNFAAEVQRYRVMRRRGSHLPLVCRQASYIDFSKAATGLSPAISVVDKPAARFNVRHSGLSLPMRPQELFSRMLSSAPTDGNSFWLDSARTSSGDSYSRFSYMGVSTRCLRYSQGTITVCVGDRTKTVQLDPATTFWRWLEGIQSDLHLHTQRSDESDYADFACGLVGYFGYELGRESLDGYTAAQEQISPAPPDAEFMVVDRMIAFDHLAETWHAVCLLRTSLPSAQTKLEEALGCSVGLTTEDFTSWMHSLESLPLEAPSTTPQDTSLPNSFRFNISRQSYLQRFEELKDAIGRGDSYEMNLTGQFRATLKAPLSADDAQDLYCWLRMRNPAGQSAFISFPSTKTHILSTSPELFIRLEGSAGRQAVMKPIKGTLRRTLCTCEPVCVNPSNCEERRRAEDALRLNCFASDPKEQAENLMIVDLIKADLHNFCHTSTVRVTKLMDVEQSETVYSLVTTVEGRLVPGVGPVEAIRRSFPPGSMTGTPKLRTVQLLEGLESAQPRGVYSGCIGYLSVDNKACFNVVIRTLVIRDCEASVGAGGAITWLSDGEKEWDEVYLKARSVLHEHLL